METIYWITRLDGILALAIAVIIIMAIIALSAVISLTTDNIDEETATRCKKCLRITIPSIFLLSLVLTFVPTTNDAYIIYGIGGTMDYLKSNKTAIGLPDKCIKALDKWADNEIKDTPETKGGSDE